MGQRGVVHPTAERTVLERRGPGAVRQSQRLESRRSGTDRTEDAADVDLGAVRARHDHVDLRRLARARGEDGPEGLADGAGGRVEGEQSGPMPLGVPSRRVEDRREGSPRPPRRRSGRSTGTRPVLDAGVISTGLVPGSSASGGAAPAAPPWRRVPADTAMAHTMANARFLTGPLQTVTGRFDAATCRDPTIGPRTVADRHASRTQSDEERTLTENRHGLPG